MTTLIKPTWLKKLIAFIIVISFVTYYGNEAGDHNLITWALGSSLTATLIKVFLLLVAFVLACVTIFSKEPE